MEKDILEIARDIFSEDFKKEKSIELNFDTENAKDLFEQLVVIFTYGCKILYGDSNGKVDLSKFTENHFFKIKQYFRSFGFDIKYSINQEIQMSSRSKNKDLSERFLKLNVNNTLYYLSFDFI